MFNKNGYEIRRDAIDTKTLDLVYEYHKLKVENNEFEIDTAQVTGTITMYGDTLNDAILRWSLPFAQEVIGEELYPCYSFLRIYNNGDILEPHCDRPSCEFSATLPIYFDIYSTLSLLSFLSNIQPIILIYIKFLIFAVFLND